MAFLPYPNYVIIRHFCQTWTWSLQQNFK